MISFLKGTGKSYLITTLTEELELAYNDAQRSKCIVATLAPTGIAAFNVNGTTIHSTCLMRTCKIEKK